ncbi:MAG: pyridoxal 5'-phosphate synthase glutaminase subunit PdxT [Chloroherpetonaceae bacterium]|nr:pyridoxal 5'-phosphate synthase glutaminase subunit PdxT [Chthonomonadaceae bacterium]MDW8209431.1 pyridoxal 5'-phosphate synthase glutaminase subunit PdxT [Chloroherpetonaceae bacterium]
MSHKDLSRVNVGILALQGDFEAHQRMLEERVGVATSLVRTPRELATVDALVLPGGESTTIGKLMERIGLDRAIRERAQQGMPLFGTCAGLILLAQDIEGRPEQPTLGLLPITVARNAFGRQVDSFEADIPVQLRPDGPSELMRGVFIRAPYVTCVEPEVQILARFQGKVVAVRQERILAIAFHPELTDDPRIHAFFVDLIPAAS